MAKKGRPGIMLYFDTKPLLQYLDNDDCGRLFRAILDYGETGENPKFSQEDDLALCVAWGALKPRLDYDAEQYKEKCRSNQYAVYVRRSKESGEQPLSRAEWELQQMSTDDCS